MTAIGPFRRATRALCRVLECILAGLVVFPGCSPRTDLFAFAIANDGSDGNRNKDGSDDNKDDLPDFHAIEDWWQVRSSSWNNNIRRRDLRGHDLIRHQAIEWCVVIQGHLFKQSEMDNKVVS